MSRFLRYWPLLLLGGGGLIIILVLEVLRASGSVRRLLAMGVGGFLVAAFLGMVAGNLGLQFTEPSRPEAAYAAAGVVFLVTLITVAIGVMVAYRRQRQAAATSRANDSVTPAADAPQTSEAPASASTPVSTSPTTASASQPVVVVQGTSPKVATVLEEKLQAVAALVGAPLVVQVTSRCPVRGRRLERGILLQVPRPRVDLVLDALEMALQGVQVLPAAVSGASFSQAHRDEDRGEKAGEAMAITTVTTISNKKKKPRPEDLAAAMGGRGSTEQ
jgi:hypothetical protein